MPLHLCRDGAQCHVNNDLEKNKVGFQGLETIGTDIDHTPFTGTDRPIDHTPLLLLRDT